MINTSFAFDQTRNKQVNLAESLTSRFNNTTLGLEVRHYLQPNRWFIGTGLEVNLERSSTEENGFNFKDTYLNWYLQPGV
ncbi:MAG: hypothetical protein AB8G22_05475, partial [Saprospiraceae bacterium]